MRNADFLRTFTSLVFAFLFCSVAAAEKPKAVIVASRIGLPPGAPAPGRDEAARTGHIVKFATWAPIYLGIEIVDEIKEPAVLVIETPDGDEVGTTLTIPLTGLNDARPGQLVTTRDLGVMPYIRPASGSSDTTLRIRTAKGSDLSPPHRIQNLFPLNNRTYVVLSLGSKLPGFDLPRETTDEEEIAKGFRKGRVETAAITDVSDLPDRWFGYDAADLVVLTTGAASDDFLRRLFGDQASASDKAKREALLEWVRRGGRLVVSVGSNAGLLAQFPAFLDLLPATLSPERPARSETSLTVTWDTQSGGKPQMKLEPKTGTMSVANLEFRPEKRSRRLLERTAIPLAAQNTLGLGRVTVLGFDLDRPPFSDSAQKADFWDWTLRECGANLASTGVASTVKSYSNTADEEDELTAALRTHVDTFEGVPVISFGWVAVFIVFYILLIGPAEYYFLKRVLGRLELTWITFPIIVLSVSAAAYFTAYAVKGRDLRVNKVDVVDVDATSGRVYGQTWFTLFSPRIDTYTVTVSPAAGWTAQTPEETAHDTLTGWVAGPKGGRASLVRRSYSYHVDVKDNRFADALVDVPIQVWSTKTFTARWSAPMDPKQPVIESRLRHPPGDATQVIGSIVNRIPLGEIRDAVVIYDGNAYPKALGNLVPGVERQLVLNLKESSDTWLTPDAIAANNLLGLESGRSRRFGGQDDDVQASASSPFPMFSVLFHERALRNDAGTALKNSSLRGLDQSWRLEKGRRDEVIVVGRLALTTGPAVEALGERYSPSQLWLHGMPGDGKPRTPIPGAGRQETFVRLYLPVK